ncbi:MAG: hypothetical protein V3T31_06310, partial [candidate division Zixibacteria bacterium]
MHPRNTYRGLIGLLLVILLAATSVLAGEKTSDQLLDELDQLTANVKAMAQKKAQAAKANEQPTLSEKLAPLQKEIRELTSSLLTSDVTDQELADGVTEI